MEDQHFLHLHKIFQVSQSTLPFFVGKGQNEIERFVFCGIEKLSKITQALLRLYPDMENSPDLEFSIGILIRSLMMDDLMVLGIKNEVYNYALIESDKNILTEKVKELCYKYISDGTSQLIAQAINSTQMDSNTKIDVAKRFAMTFVKAFDIPENGAKPKIKTGFKISPAILYEKMANTDLIRKEEVYDFYCFYSKYDHLSHWTGLAKDIPFENRRLKIQLATVIMVMHLRDMLAIAFDFGNGYEKLEPYVDDLNDYLQTIIQE